jgi:hypothetical protein
MSVVTHIEPEVLTFSTHATLTTSVGTTPRVGDPKADDLSGSDLTSVF